MDTKNLGNPLRIALHSVAAASLFAAGVGAASAAAPETPASKGQAFVIGTDAPLASVVSFSVQIQSIDAVTSGGVSVPLLSGSPTIDFARFNGLQTLIDMNDVPVGTYDKLVVTLGPATLGYLATQPGPAPAIQTLAATLTKTVITHTLAHPLVVSATEPVGVRMDFDLHKSIDVSSSGQISGTVNPTFNISVVRPTDPGAYIDQFDAAVLSVDAGTQSFIIVGPHGRHWTINVTGQTEWDKDATLADLNTSTIVQVSGFLERADSTITADEVGILSQSGFYAGGQATFVTPSTGAATIFDLYVRGLLPTTTGLTQGQIAQIDLTGSEKYFVLWAHNPLTEFVFNSSALLAGQSIAVGGPATGAVNADAVTVKRIVLRNWGFNGKVVPGSVKVGKGTFEMKIDGFAGILVPQTVTVYVSDRTEFRFGYTGLHELGANDQVRVVGLLLKNPTTGATVLVGRYVDALD
jgi:hypothetical protein